MSRGEQMLADLGYEVITNTPDYKFFRKNNLGDYFSERDCFEIEFNVAEDFVDKQLFDRSAPCHMTTDLDFDELLACAEIVKEIRER